MYEDVVMDEVITLDDIGQSYVPRSRRKNPAPHEGPRKSRGGPSGRVGGRGKVRADPHEPSPGVGDSHFANDGGIEPSGNKGALDLGAQSSGSSWTEYARLLEKGSALDTYPLINDIPLDPKSNLSGQACFAIAGFKSTSTGGFSSVAVSMGSLPASPF